MNSSDRALAELYASQRDVLRRLAFILCGNAQVAEEIVQEAFLQLHRRWQTVDNPPGYLRTTVVNGSRSHHRRRALEQRWVAPRPDVTYQEHDEVRDSLAKLSSRQRAALAMRYYLDLPDHAIGAALGVRESTVRSLLRRGLAALREELS